MDGAMEELRALLVRYGSLDVKRTSPEVIDALGKAYGHTFFGVGVSFQANADRVQVRAGSAPTGATTLALLSDHSYDPIGPTR